MPKVKCNCSICFKEFYIWPSAIKQGKGKTCSYECLCKYRSINIHKGNFKIGFNHTKETIDKFKIQRKGNKNINWKGGRNKTCKNGYIRIYTVDHPNRNKNNRIY